MWSWSHSQEAYENAEYNVRQLSTEELRTIWAEWKAQAKDEDGNLIADEMDLGNTNDSKRNRKIFLMTF